MAEYEAEDADTDDAGPDRPIKADRSGGEVYDQDYLDEICDWMMDLGAIENTAHETYTIPLGGSSVMYELPGWGEHTPGYWYLGNQPLNKPLTRSQVRRLMDIFGVKKPEIKFRDDNDKE